MALPTRTIVAPARIARSKSPLMPIEQVARPSASDRLRSVAKLGVGSPASGGTVMRPSTASPCARQRSTRAAVSAGAQPPFCASPATFTCTRTRAPGARRRDLRRQLVTVDGLPERDIGRDSTHLVALQPADEVPARRAGVIGTERARFRREVLRAVLAHIGRAGRDRVAYRVDPDGLGHDHQGDVPRITPAILCRTGDTRPNRGQRLGNGHDSTATVI